MNMDMDLQIAMNLLETDMDQLSSFDSNSLRKQYHKMALKYHPDKHGNSENSTIHFQNIQTAYHYLLIFTRNETPNENEFSSKEENNSSKEEINYYEILSSFIKQATAHPSTTGHLFASIVKEILTGFVSITLFDSVDKEVALEIYSFLEKHKQIICINDVILDKVRDILFKKYQNTHLITINPRISDMFSSSVYKLVFKEEIFYIPMWHEEVHYDCLHGHPREFDELIIRCIPDLPDNVTIDEQNNILVVINLDIKKIDLKSGKIPFSIEDHEFTIPCSSLFIKPVQRYTIKCAGIPRIDDTDMYNDAIKSDIIVKIILSQQ